jgi:hypothetical protein
MVKKGGNTVIELAHDSLVFTFPDVHPKAKLTINFQRTLRIPDDGKDYPLPPGLGRFPIKHVDDYKENLPQQWAKHGGVMLPMYQSEAMWLNFNSDYISSNRTKYPFAIKVATGKINAVTGDSWTDWLQRNPQDYMVSTEQPWLDGFNVEKGIIRQFVAMPLGSGYSVEEQITGKDEFGGLQIIVYPMKREVFEKRFPERDREVEIDLCLSCKSLQYISDSSSIDMALAPGGRMRQEIYEDPFDMDDWEMRDKSRCFIHLTNSLVWREITGNNPPTVPFTAKEYAAHNMPWFAYYSEGAKVLEGSNKLSGAKSIKKKAAEKGDNPIPDNSTVFSDPIINVSKSKTKTRKSRWRSRSRTLKYFIEK